VLGNRFFQFAALVIAVLALAGEAEVCEGACPAGDLDGNCRVNFSDLRIFAAEWLEGVSAADLDNNDSVSASDLAILSENWLTEGQFLVINEFMASNGNTVENPDDPGEFDDWLEIHNCSGLPVDVGGMYLTDDLDDGTKWRIPDNISAETTIPAGGYLVIWADKKAYLGGLHANFKLSADGEEIGLFGSDGYTVIDDLSYGSQSEDISRGRYPDGQGQWYYFQTATPGAANLGQFINKVADTQFSHDRGFYQEPIELTISSATPGATIRYTTGGACPSPDYGTIYTGPIPISETTVIRAIAYKENYEPANIDSQTYLFLEDVIDLQYPDSYPTRWRTVDGISVVADYAMDARVVEDPAYSGRIKDDLKSLPTVSIVMKQQDLFDQDNGIYANPEEDGLQWERQASVEFFGPGIDDDFKINCGIRTMGGYSADPEATRKHSFRLIFRDEYGPSKLEYPLFDDSEIEKFDHIVLRAGANDSYGQQAETAQYTRDEFHRRTGLAMGKIHVHGRFVHLYLNGIYWGLYNLIERPNDAFCASYFGGEKAEWDIIKNNSVRDGTDAAWRQVQSIASQPLENMSNYDSFKKMVDVDNLIDYILVEYYAGNIDWPHNNWVAGRRRKDGHQFKFFLWDVDWAWGVPSHDVDVDRTGASNGNVWNVGGIHHECRANSEYRLRFADHIQKHLFHDGTLSASETLKRFLEVSDEVRPAIVPESARWGDTKVYSRLYTLDNQWLGEFEWLRDVWFPVRPAILFNQLKNWNLYPDVDPAEFYAAGQEQHGGTVSYGQAVELSCPQGDIYYTLDGTDPRVRATTGDSITVVQESAAKRVIIPTAWNPSDEGWQDVGFFDGGWNEADYTGTGGGVGYDRYTDYAEYISYDVEQAMDGQNSSCYIRIPFRLTSEQLNGASSLILRMRYEDGFAAYINGQRAVSDNAPVVLSYDSAATGSRSDSQAVNFADFDISSYLEHLRCGQNILAIHGLNVSVDNSDFLISAELVIQKQSTGGNYASSRAELYDGPINLSGSRLIRARAKSSNQWSALDEAMFSVGPVAQNLRVTEIMYHPADIPEQNPDAEYIELQNTGPEEINLGFVRFTDGVRFEFDDMTLAGGEYVVVVKDPDVFVAQYPNFTGRIAGTFEGRLDNGGEGIRLQDAAGGIIQEFDYEDGWYDHTDGEGFSLVCIDANNPDQMLWSQKQGWRPSAYSGGSPGQDDSQDTYRPRSVVINEVMTHTDFYPGDWIELHNTTDAPIDIGGWYLSDSEQNLRKYRIGDNTIIGEGGYAVFTQNENFGTLADPGCSVTFGLNQYGETVYLTSAQDGQLTGYRDREDFGASENGVSIGRHYKASTDTYNFVAMSTPTFDGKNSYPRVGPVVISEIMYHPDSNENAEYIELKNISDQPVTLYDFVQGAGWKFNDGVEYTFDSSATIQAGGYLLIAKDPAVFAEKYGDVPAGVDVLGPYAGQLDNSAEKLQLAKPSDIDPETGVRHYIRVERVNYSDGSHPDEFESVDPWPGGADGNSMSLTSRDVTLYGNDSASWAASVITPGLRCAVKINEFMANNVSTIEDPDEAGEYPAWIELYNPHPFEVSLEGMYLSNEAGNPKKWQLPSEMTIAGGQWVLFWADGETSQGPRHINFTLNSAGGEISLFDDSGAMTEIDNVSYGPQQADISYGRRPDGSTQFGPITKPSPGDRYRYNLISHWKLDGNALDEVRGNHGTLVGNPQWESAYIGQGIRIDSDGDGIDFGDVEAFDFGAEDSFSVTTWFKCSENSGTLFTKRQFDEQGYVLSGYYAILFAGGQLHLKDTQGNSSYVASDSLVSNNQWHWMVLVRDALADELKLYIDGQLKGTAVDTTTAALGTEASFIIGFDPGGMPSFNGVIDDFRVYGQSLNSSEITDISAEY